MLSEQAPSSSLLLSRFTQSLPKIELHAHLNGCVREETTLRELASERGYDFPKSIRMYSRRTLPDCFALFGEIGKCVNDLDALERITREMLEDFVEQNVIYLELRSTPKRLLRTWKDPTHQSTKRDYVETILRVMREYQNKITSRLIVSIDRAKSVQEAQENVDLAIHLHKEPSFVVGVEVGGNPTENDIRDYLPLLEKARFDGLRVSIHSGEIPCSDDPSTQPYQEWEAILRFRPDRLGHALWIPPTLLREQLSCHPIPVECCPTSNLMTLDLWAPDASGDDTNAAEFREALQKKHPQLSTWLKEGYPFSINTDDPGVFFTDSSKECFRVASTFGLSCQRIQEIVVESMGHAFCDAVTKRAVQTKIQDFRMVE